MTKAQLKAAVEEFNMRCKFIKEATYNGLFSETTEQQEQRIKHLLKPENYTEFFDYYFGMNTPIPLADAPCADFHQNSYQEVFHNPWIVQFRKWFRGAAKSIHTNVGNFTHLKENNELNFGLLIGQNEEHGKRLLSDLQAHLMSNERYIKDFGLQHSYGSWADGNFECKDGTYFKGLGIDQPFRGLRVGANRVDAVSLDDVEDRKIAKNKARVKERVEKITGDVVKAFGKHRGRLIIPNNYIVKNGLLDGIETEMKDNPNLSVNQVNLSDENGNPSWHQRYTKKEVESINLRTDYFTSQREDYNNPIEKGKRFKTEWIRYRKIPKDVVWEALVCYWDLSYTDNGDYKAGVIIGVYKGQMYVIDVFCRRCDISEAMNWHYETMKRYAAMGLKPICYYDATAAQKAVYNPIFIQYASIHKFYEIPMPDLSQNVDKHLRIDATLTNVLFNGTLVFNEELKDTSDMEAGVLQLLSFEKGTKDPDDFPDSLENAVRKIQVYAMDMGEESWGNPHIVQRSRGGF